MYRAKLLLGLSLSMLSVCNGAFAQNESDIDDAYQKAADGLRQYKAGRYAEALDNYTRAYAIVRLPALAVHIARANVQLGRYVAAKQFFDEALSLPDGVGDPQVQARARTEARSEGQSLLARIPRLLFRISGVSSTDVAIRVDGASVPTNAYGSGWLVDPGSHQVLASLARQEQRRWVAVAEGDVRELTFTFVSTSTTPLAGSNTRDTVGSSDTPSTTRTLAWVSIGIGSAGVLVWGTAGLVALKKSSHLNALSCGANKPPCPTNEVDSYDNWKTASTVGFYTGAATLLTGATLFFVASHEKKSRDAKVGVVPWLGIGSAGVEGRF